MVDAVFHKMVSETSTALPPPSWRRHGKRRRMKMRMRKKKKKNSHGASHYVTRRVILFHL
jgi:hypothetical protein